MAEHSEGRRNLFYPRSNLHCGVKMWGLVFLSLRNCSWSSLFDADTKHLLLYWFAALICIDFNLQIPVWNDSVSPDLSGCAKVCRTTSFSLTSKLLPLTSPPLLLVPSSLSWYHSFFSWCSLFFFPSLSHSLSYHWHSLMYWCIPQLFHALMPNVRNWWALIRSAVSELPKGSLLW